MLNWYKNLYVGETVKKKEEKTDPENRKRPKDTGGVCGHAGFQ